MDGDLVFTCLTAVPGTLRLCLEIGILGVAGIPSNLLSIVPDLFLGTVDIEEERLVIVCGVEGLEPDNV